jgi:hypothetical protein
MQSYPLTRATFLEYAVARSAGSAFADVDATTIERWVAWASATVQSAMGDRITPPLLEWDEYLEGHAVMLAWRPIMTARGYKKDSGRDAMIDEMAKQADAYLARLRPGGEFGKSENPMFVDSGGNVPRDSIRVVAERSSSAFLLNSARCRSRCC